MAERISVGDKVRIARDAQVPPVSLRVLASKTGLTKAKINMWETPGRTKHPKREDIEAVAEFLKIPVDWFYDGQPGDPPKKETEPSNVTRVNDDKLKEGFVVMVAIRTWECAAAADGDDDDVEFVLAETPQEIPIAFITGGYSQIDNYELLKVAGRSLMDVVSPGEFILIRKDQTPYRNTIGMTTAPSGKVLVKAVRMNKEGFVEYHSLRDGYPAFLDTSQWRHHGYAVAIIGDDDGDGRNIRWNFGRAIKV